jgi:transposase
MNTTSQIWAKYCALSGHLDERGRRIWAAAEAQPLGHGGVTLVSNATGIARSTIHRGLAEIATEIPLTLQRVRKPGGGRKPIAYHDPSFPKKLESLIEPLTRGDPESPLRWTCKSTRQLAEELEREGTKVGRQTVAAQLHRLGYSLQANKKTEEGASHPDRNAQFEYINRRAKQGIAHKQPVISVDTKKKELVGNYKNNGQKWHRKGQAPKVQGHDFPNPEVPRAYPYGVYDLKQNVGFVNVGSDHDTSAFAVASIRAWWSQVGCKAYPDARFIQIMADSGGSNGYNRRLWKWELQALADETGLPIRVSHFPPGTSKWNKVEHRLFSCISQNWRGEPLTSYETVVALIASTTTATGLKVHCRLDMNKYPLKQKVTKKEMKAIRLKQAIFHGEWNYKIMPRKK